MAEKNIVNIVMACDVSDPPSSDGVMC